MPGFKDPIPNAKFEADCRTYVAELRADSVISRSHYTLNSLYLRYGKTRTDQYVDQLLTPVKQGK